MIQTGDSDAGLPETRVHDLVKARVTGQLDGARQPAAAGIAADHLVSPRDAIPGVDQRSLRLAATVVRHAAGQRQ